MSKIYKLTKKQWTMVDVYIERYRTYGLSTDPADRPAAEAATDAFAARYEKNKVAA